MEDETTFAKYFKKLCLTFDDSKTNKETYDVYLEALDSYSDNEIACAVQWLIENYMPTAYKPFPVPAEIIQCIKDKREDERQKKKIFRAEDLPYENPNMRKIRKMIDDLGRKMSLKEKENDDKNRTDRK